MAYIKTVWKNNTTKLNATNMNHIEQGIADAFTEIAKNTSAIDKKQNITSYKTINGESITGTGDITLTTAESLQQSLQAYYTKAEVDALVAPESSFTVNGKVQQGPEIVLTANNSYELSGTLHGHIIISGSDKENTQIVFNNVTIKSDKAQALYCNQAKSRTVITLLENTKNYIETPAIECSADNSEAALQAEDRLVIISGESSELHVKAPGHNQHAIKGSRLLLSGAGSIFVTAGHDGFHGGKLLRIDSGNYFVIEAAVDAIEAKLVQIFGGTIHVYKYGAEGNAISSKETPGIIAGQGCICDIAGDEIQALRHFDNIKALDAVPNKPAGCPVVTRAQYFGEPVVYESKQKVTKDSIYGDKDGFPIQGWFDTATLVTPDAAGKYTTTKQYVYVKGYIQGSVVTTVAKTKFYTDNVYIEGKEIVLQAADETQGITEEKASLAVWYHPSVLEGKLEVKGRENSINYFTGDTYGMLADAAISLQEDANYFIISPATAVRTGCLQDSYIFTKGDGLKYFQGAIGITSTNIYFSIDKLNDPDLPNVFEVGPIIVKGVLQADEAIYIPYSQAGFCLLDTYDTRDLVKFDLPGFTTMQLEKAQVIVENKKELLNSLRAKIYELQDMITDYIKYGKT